MTKYILDTDCVSLILYNHPQIITKAENCLKKLLKDYPPLRKKRIQKDLRIASIALSIDAIVVTRNQRDFSQIPRLLIEDWTI